MKALFIDFENLKNELSSYRGKRTVETWNNLREVAKGHYDQNVINMLDSSGFIKEWLREED